MSWLERAEQADEVDERFIAAWIGFNALYGQLDGEHQPLPEREAMGAFLAAMWRLDDREQLRTPLNRKRMAALNLLDNKYLYDRFWKQPNVDCSKDLHEEVRRLIAMFGPKRMRLNPTTSVAETWNGSHLRGDLYGNMGKREQDRRLSLSCSAEIETGMCERPMM